MTEPVESKIPWEEHAGLFVGQAVLIRRTSGAEQKAVVRSIRPRNEYCAPEVVTFSVEWIGEDGRAYTKGCGAIDLLPWPIDWARRVS